MKKIALIYNPFSGDRTFKGELDVYTSTLQAAGFLVQPFRLDGSLDLGEFIASLRGFDAIAASGGDGTVNSVINEMVAHDVLLPLAIIPSGTANDFANFIGMSVGAQGFADAVGGGNTILADIGQANNKYFINVCGAGLFTHVSQRVNEGMKSTLGKLAYYVKGLEEVPNFHPMSVRITNSERTRELDIFLFLALNTAGTGGFPKLVRDASISDGMLDFIAIKACNIMDLGKLFFKILRQQDIFSDPNVIYFQDDFVQVELLAPNPSYDTCDIDGEYGPKLPVEIRNLPKKIPLIVPKEFP
ncbi:MAG: YegS/Rv2252/BmrU family lipid kinase [Defluviitaleaceae bacterium]|nr:YegS/Rv2252/BmrU family lipid kinase [Defluviitaleaceae bacterium]